MKDPIEIKGLWWLPEDDSIQLPGTLSFSQQDGAILELIGTFRDAFSNQKQDAQVILGISQEGNQVSLHKCTAASWSAPVLSLGSSKYSAHFIFVGTHFIKEQDARFNTLTASYTDLDIWAHSSGLRVDFVNPEYDGFEVNFYYRNPSSMLYSIGDGYHVGIEFAPEVEHRALPFKQARITQRARLAVKHATDDVSFELMLGRLNQLVYLHQLAVQRMNYPLKITGISKSNMQIYGEGKHYFPPIEIYFRPIESIVERGDSLPRDILFTFVDLEQQNVDAWFQSFAKYETMIHLYRSLFYSDRLFSDTKFLYITQALESLHNTLFDGRYLDRHQFRERKRRALTHVDDDLKNWVEDGLAQANYKRLRVKLSELLEPKMHLFGGAIANAEKFIESVVATRNYLVHYNKGVGKFQYGEELVTATLLLRYLFETYILELLRFEPPKIEAIFKKRIEVHLQRWPVL